MHATACSFVVRVPDSLPMAGAAPLLCAGITVYSPLRYYGLDKPGMKVGAGARQTGHGAIAGSSSVVAYCAAAYAVSSLKLMLVNAQGPGSLCAAYAPVCVQ
jgi:D-arabinose 1-dehydrogenase-like Zn-dependent alcohol dehydrogenase